MTFLRRCFFFTIGVFAAAGSIFSVVLDWPGYTRWVDELLLIVAVAALAFAWSVGITRRRPYSWSWQWLLIFSSICLISGVANHVSWLELVGGWRSTARFLLFFLVATWFGTGPSEARAFVSGFLSMVLVHASLGIIQYTRAGSDLGFDDVTGGFGPGTANLFGYVCCFAIFICLGGLIVARRKGYVLMIPPIAFAWGLTSAQGSYIIFVGGLILAFVIVHELRQIWVIALLAVMIGSGAMLFISFLKTHFHESVLSVVTGGSLAAMTQSSAESTDIKRNPGRLVMLAGAFRLIGRHWRTIPFGVGTGSVGTIVGDNLRNSNFAAYQALSGATFIPSSLVIVLTEVGIAGVLFSLYMPLRVMAYAAAMSRRVAMPEKRVFLVLAVILGAGFVVASLGEAVWSFKATAYPFWLLAAFSVEVRNEEARRRNRSAYVGARLTVPADAGHTRQH